jgi:tRNA(Ile)-lysidine synthase
VSGLLETVDQNIQQRGLFRRAQRILVAVSGGVDSMVLLRLLHQLSKLHRWKLTVAHLNHQLRGRSGDADERLVERTSKVLRLPIVVERADVKRRAKTNRVSLEMAAREARHEFLARTAVRLKIPAIALAHHADDQVELFFLRLLRGAGSEGIAGMKWQGRSPVASKIDLVRPLLGQSKESLREYAIQGKIQFREDASNASVDILRNRIRHELLPLLREKYQPAIDRLVFQLIDIVAADAELVHEAARNWLDSRDGASRFEGLPTAIQRRVLQLVLRRKKIAADFWLVERLRMYPHQPVTVSPGKTVLWEGSGELQVGTVKKIESNSGQVILDLRGVGGTANFGGRVIHWRKTAQKSFRVPVSESGKETFDAEMVGTQIVLRHWQPGDRFQPIGMAKLVKMQDFFVNNGIPRGRRHELIVATTVQGEVFWVEGMRIAERFKLIKSTKHQLMWQWKLG